MILEKPQRFAVFITMEIALCYCDIYIETTEIGAISIAI